MWIFCGWGLLYQSGEVGGTSMKICAIGGLRLTYPHSSLEGWLVYSPKEIAHAGASINSRIIIRLEVLLLV